MSLSVSLNSFNSHFLRQALTTKRKKKKGLLNKEKRLFEASFVLDESSASNADVAAIPSQHKITQQILSHWQPFIDLKLMFAGLRRAEQLCLWARVALNS
jgi:hypothetical protein